MIKADKKAIAINGQPVEIISETALLLRMVYNHMIDTFGKEEADNLLTEIGRITVATPEELNDMMGSAVAELAKEMDKSYEL